MKGHGPCQGGRIRLLSGMECQGLKFVIAWRRIHNNNLLMHSIVDSDSFNLSHSRLFGNAERYLQPGACPAAV